MNKDKVIVNAPASLIELVNKKIKQIEDEMISQLSYAERKDLERIERGETVPGFPLDLDILKKEFQQDLKQRIPLARKIWRWADAMNHSDIVKLMIFVGHEPIGHKMIVFWSGSRPLLKNTIKLALSFRNGLILFYDDRIFDYTVFRSAKHLAENLGMDTLRDIWTAIDDDSVWKNIEQGFEYLQEKDRK